MSPEPEPTEPAAAGGPGRGTRTMVALVLLAVIVAAALVAVDLTIKQDLVRRAKALDDRLREAEHEHASASGTADRLPGGGDLGAVEQHPHHEPGAPAPGALASPAGGLLARGPGDRSDGHES